MLFRSDDIVVLIMQLKSGSEGLNLQQYNAVFLVAPWWNPGVEAQAIARVHRLGQTRPVVVHCFYQRPSAPRVHVSAAECDVHAPVAIGTDALVTTVAVVVDNAIDATDDAPSPANPRPHKRRRKHALPTAVETDMTTVTAEPVTVLSAALPPPTSNHGQIGRAHV